MRLPRSAGQILLETSKWAYYCGLVRTAIHYHHEATNNCNDFKNTTNA